MSKPQLKEVDNERAVTKAIAEFAKRVHQTLHTRPEMHGSITLTLHCAYGQIKKFDLTDAETQICQN